MLGHSCTSAAMNYTAERSSHMYFWNLALSFGFCVVVNTAWFIRGYKTACMSASSSRGEEHESLLLLLTHAGWHRLCLHGWDHIYKQGSCGKVMSGQLDDMDCSPRFPFSSCFSSFCCFHSLSLKCTLSFSLSPFLQYVSFVLALFWYMALLMRSRGDVMQVCTHECLSRNFTLYFSHVRIGVKKG